MTTATTKSATYNGKTYRLLWLGETKYGRRAHLQFFDGSKDFWVDAAKVRERSSQSSSATGGKCDDCGRWTRHLYECYDASGIAGMCCRQCASGPDYERSFA